MDQTLILNKILEQQNLNIEESMYIFNKIMSGDYETLEINQPKISYFQKRSENNTEWLDELINKIEDMKNNISKSA